MTGICLLSNPGSTNNAKSLDRVERVLEGAREVDHFYIGRWADIPELLDNVARARPEILLINGGDGTVGQVLAAMLEDCPFASVPIIGVLPGGQTNMLAGDLGTGGSSARVLKRILRSLNESRPMTVERNILKVETAGNAAAARGFFFGGAAVINGIEYCREHIYPRNMPMPIAHSAAIGLLLTGVLSGGTIGPDVMKSGDLEITLDGVGYGRRKLFAVLATTMDRLILGLRPFAREGDGPFKFTAVEHGPSATARTIPRLWGAGGKTSEPGHGIFTRRVSDAKITTSGSFTLDGEFFHPGPETQVHITSNESLSFIAL